MHICTNYVLENITTSKLSKKLSPSLVIVSKKPKKTLQTIFSVYIHTIYMYIYIYLFINNNDDILFIVLIYFFNQRTKAHSQLA